MGEETEIKTKGEECILMNPCSALIIQVGQYPPVTPQKKVNIPDKAVGILVKPVVVVIPALIGTEFFVGPAPEDITAVETLPFHNAKVLIKIVKNVLKRLQTILNE